MRITIPSFEINVETYQKSPSSKYLFLLHGFTGAAKDWAPIAKEITGGYNIAAVDLPGHGKSDSPQDSALYSTQAIVSQLHKVFTSFTEDKFFLLGYSMGGRAALSFTINFPDLIEGLILESASPGLKTPEERDERYSKDKILADFILKNHIEEFADYWMNLDIFNTQKRFSNTRLQQIRESKILNNKTGLSNSLLGFSTGIMPSYWDKLKPIKCSTLLVTGELDTKFTSINSKMAPLFPDAEHKIIPSAGHNVHLEMPKEFLFTLNDFLKKFLTY